MSHFKLLEMSVVLISKFHVFKPEISCFLSLNCKFGIFHDNLIHIKGIYESNYLSNQWLYVCNVILTIVQDFELTTPLFFFRV